MLKMEQCIDVDDDSHATISHPELSALRLQVPHESEKDRAIMLEMQRRYGPKSFDLKD